MMYWNQKESFQRQTFLIIMGIHSNLSISLAWKSSYENYWCAERGRDDIARNRDSLILVAAEISCFLVFFHVLRDLFRGSEYILERSEIILRE